MKNGSVNLADVGEIIERETRYPCRAFGFNFNAAIKVYIDAISD